jgi:hypothetical protein
VFNITPPPCTGNLPCTSTATQLILWIINIILSLSGLIAVLVVVIGGFRYLTSMGNEEVTSQAKKMILNAIIGIIIIVLSFVIVRVITNGLAGHI